MPDSQSQDLFEDLDLNMGFKWKVVSVKQIWSSVGLSKDTYEESGSDSDG
mgnify:CR=1 FL=1